MPLIHASLSLLQNSGDGFFFAVFGAASLALTALALAGLWLTFMKAGQPGWGVLIPFYNLWLIVRIAERPALWFWLMFIPGVNVVLGLIMSIDIAERFGKSAGFGVGLFFLGVVFYPILGFGDARYEARGPR